MNKELWSLIDKIIETGNRLILDEEGIRVIDVVELRYLPINSWVSLNPDYASVEEIEKGINVSKEFLSCH